jgi:hypothetical protein
VHYVAPGLFHGDATAYVGERGYVLSDISVGGLTLSSSYNYGDIWAKLGIKMVICSFDDSLGFGVGETYDQILASADAGSVADWVMVLNHPAGPDISTGRPPMTIAETILDQKKNIKAWCERNDENYVDFSSFIKTFDEGVKLGLINDNIHLTPLGYFHRANFISNALCPMLESWGASVPLNDTAANNIEVNAFEVRLNCIGKQFNILGNGFGMASYSNPSRENYLNFGYTGKGSSPGMSFGWGVNEVPGVYKNALSWATTGNTGTKITQSSDWPLAINMKSSTVDTPTSSATLHTYYNGTKWELRVKTPSGTDHVVWTEP